MRYMKTSIRSILVWPRPCIPFSSCNAGVFGGSHSEHYPVVAFYTRPAIAEVILTCTQEAQIGLETSERGYLIAYADDIRALRQFAGMLMDKRKLFRSPRISRTSKPDRKSDQGSLF